MDSTPKPLDWFEIFCDYSLVETYGITEDYRFAICSRLLYFILNEKKFGFDNIKEILIKFMHESNQKNSKGDSVISILAQFANHFNPEIIKLIIEKNPSCVNSHGGETGYSPLMWAVLCVDSTSNFETVKLLIDSGANINFQNTAETLSAAKDGLNHWTALMIATSMPVTLNTVKVIKLLIDKGGDVNLCNKEYVSLFDDDSDAVKQSNSALTYASVNSLAIVKLLIQSGANIKQKGLLKYAIKNLKNSPYDKQLLNTSEEDPDLRMYIQHFGTNGLDIIKYLIKEGADVNDEAPLCAAAVKRESNVDLIKILLEAGADVNQLSKSKDSALILVIRHSKKEHKMELVKLLLDAGADVNIVGCFGKTALHTLAQSTDGLNVVEIAKMLLNKGADVNIENNFGGTALSIADGHYDDIIGLDIIRLLILAGADIKRLQHTRERYFAMYVYKRVNRKLNDENCLILLTPIKDDGEYFMCVNKEEHVYSKESIESWGRNECQMCRKSFEVDVIYVNK